MTSEEAADLIKWKGRAEQAERERDELRCELGAIRESTKLAEAARDALVVERNALASANCELKFARDALAAALKMAVTECYVCDGTAVERIIGDKRQRDPDIEQPCSFCSSLRKVLDQHAPGCRIARRRAK